MCPLYFVTVSKKATSGRLPWENPHTFSPTIFHVVLKKETSGRLQVSTQCKGVFFYIPFSRNTPPPNTLRCVVKKIPLHCALTCIVSGYLRTIVVHFHVNLSIFSLLQTPQMAVFTHHFFWSGGFGGQSGEQPPPFFFFFLETQNVALVLAVLPYALKKGRVNTTTFSM